MSSGPLEKLVCQECWDAPFSTEYFQTAWTYDSSIPFSSQPPYKTTWGKILAYNDSGCSWCKLLYDISPRSWSTSMGDQAQLEIRAAFFKTEGFAPTGRNLLMVSINNDADATAFFEAHTTPDDDAAIYITAREIISQVSSQRCYSWASDCLRRCATSHEFCPKPQSNVLPTRVIDCSNPENPRILEINKGSSKASYVALSYAWGGEQPQKLTTKNLQEHLKALDTSQMPQTIRDAIWTTHKIYLRYLWVDAYCILQDSEEDKERELSRMLEIYRNATFTIIAASATKASEGFLEKRESKPSVIVPFRCPDRGRVGTMALRRGPSYTMESKEPVDFRAWCLQERMLSPRSLIYASHTLQFHCQTETVNVGGSYHNPWTSNTTRLPSLFFSTTIPSLPLPNEVLETLNLGWGRVVNNYSSRFLTEPRDKLIAVGGIAKEFQRLYRSRYLAGLWEHCLLEDLGWTKGYSCKTFPKPECYRAPSWSWAAVDGPVLPGDHAEMYKPLSGQYKCEILECKVDLASEILPFGPVLGGRLKVKALMKQVEWDPLAGEIFTTDAQRQSLGIGCADYQRQEVGSAWALALATKGTSQGRGYLVRLYISGIIVVPVDEADTYRRVASFESSWDAEKWSVEQKRTVSLV